MTVHSDVNGLVRLREGFTFQPIKPGKGRLEGNYFFKAEKRRKRRSISIKASFQSVSKSQDHTPYLLLPLAHAVYILRAYCQRAQRGNY